MIKDAVYVCRSSVKLWNTMFHPGTQVILLDIGKDEFDLQTVTIQFEDSIIVCSHYLFTTNFILLTK